MGAVLGSAAGDAACGGKSRIGTKACSCTKTITSVRTSSADWDTVSEELHQAQGHQAQDVNVQKGKTGLQIQNSISKFRILIVKKQFI